jgi:hypothetical protein
MSKRHSDALAIAQGGACNPSGIALAIAAACAEMRAEPNHKGTDEIRADPAIRLMCYQLSFLCSIDNSDAVQADYFACVTMCENITGEKH